MNYPIAEIFYTIQGEGAFTGTPSIFIRLQGCPVGCPWCDTKYTWEENDGIGRLSISEIIAYCRVQGGTHVVLTGGEPLMHDCELLIDELIDNGYIVQIETSGTFPIPEKRQNLYICVSPKFNMPGGFEVLPDSLVCADEIKMPVGKQRDIDLLNDAIQPTDYHKVWLQPLSQNKKATALCVETAKKNNWHLSVQTHKFIGIP